MLATGHIVLAADPRISVSKQHGVNTLVIKEITELDAGEYVCQVTKNAFYSKFSLILYSIQIHQEAF